MTPRKRRWALHWKFEKEEKREGHLFPQSRAETDENPDPLKHQVALLPHVRPFAPLRPDADEQGLVHAPPHLRRPLRAHFEAWTLTCFWRREADLERSSILAFRPATHSRLLQEQQALSLPSYRMLESHSGAQEQAAEMALAHEWGRSETDEEQPLWQSGEEQEG